MKSCLLFILPVVLTLQACEKKETRPVGKIIEETWSQQKTLFNPFYARQWITEREKRLRADPNPSPLAYTELGDFLLNVGDTAHSIEILEEGVKKFSARFALHDQDASWYDLRFSLAMANLRAAEEGNCIHHHNSQSCIFPIRGSGVHVDQVPARKAKNIFKKLYSENSENLDAHWLNLVAESASGGTPVMNGRSYRLNAQAATAEFKKEMRPFKEDSNARGFWSVGWASGGIMEDFNGDGAIDIMTSGYADRVGLQNARHMPWLQLFLNDGHGKFKEATKEAKLDQVYDGLNFMQTDYNNDGRPDILVLRGGWTFLFSPDQSGAQLPFSLLRNNPDGTFTDVTIEAGLLNHAPTQTAAWADLDNDGNLDLVVGFESYGKENYPLKVYHNNGDGTFSDITGKMGVAITGIIKSVSLGDIDNDGYPDLFVALADKRNLLFRNTLGDPSAHSGFVDVTSKSNLIKDTPSFASWFWDYNNDGNLDLMIFSVYRPFTDQVNRKSILKSIADYYLGTNDKMALFAPPKLFRNNGDGTFSDVTSEVGLDRAITAMGCNFGDIDNDGYPDMYIGTGGPDLSTLAPNLLFWNRGGKKFYDITFDAGVGHLQKGHGIAFGDIDGNGSQDILAVMGGAVPTDYFQRALFINPNVKNNWIKLKLVGTSANRSALGARIEVQARSADEKEVRKIFAVVGTGSSFGGNPLLSEIGLGRANLAEKVIISWPDKKHSQTILEKIPANKTYKIEQGESKAQAI